MIRTINTNSTELDLVRTYNQKHLDFKPHGLWYSLDSEWIEWCECNMEGWVRDNIIEIDVDLSNFLILETKEQVVEFSNKYGARIHPEVDMKNIQWAKLKDKYAGIEIRNYHSIKWNHNFMLGTDNIWFSGWDVSSGCIWDLSVIKSHKVEKHIKANG